MHVRLFWPDSTKRSIPVQYPTMPAFVLNSDAVKRCLPMKECIEHTAKALSLVGSSELLNPIRHGVPLPLEGKDGVHVIGFMPCYLAQSITGQGEWWTPGPHAEPAAKRRKGTGGYICCKIITVFPSNVGTGFSGHQGIVMLYSAVNGSVLSLADAHEVTGTRTAAASAVATRLFAKDGPCVLALLGSGFEAIKHLEAMQAVRPIIAVHVWSRTRSRAEAFACMHGTSTSCPISVFDSPETAVRDADIVCTLTPAPSPILRFSWLKQGAHVNAVGSCHPQQQELDEECIVRASVFCDTKEGCLNGVTRTGDLVIPIEKGLFCPEHLREIGPVLESGWSRSNPGEVTVYKSVGVAVEDLCSAVALYDKAKHEPEGSFPMM